MTNLISLMCHGDPDCPANPLSFALLPGSPAGVTIGANTGVIQWTPTLAQLRPQPDMLSVRLCDNGVPNYCVTNTVTLTVTTNSALQIQRLSGNDYQFTIAKGRTDVDYILIQSDTLCPCACQSPWENVIRLSPPTIPFSFMHRSEFPFMFFRLREVPRMP
jgi:hypothetical protein